jgi:hypothetical protein
MDFKKLSLLLWPASLIVISQRTPPPSLESYIKVGSQCDCIDKFNLSELTGAYHGMMNTICLISLAGFFLSFIMTRGLGWGWKSSVAIMWFVSLVITHPIFR